MKRPSIYKSRRYYSYRKKQVCAWSCHWIDNLDLIDCGFIVTPFFKLKRNP